MHLSKEKPWISFFKRGLTSFKKNRSDIYSSFFLIPLHIYFIWLSIKYSSSYMLKFSRKISQIKPFTELFEEDTRPLQWSSILPAPTPDSLLFSLAEEQVGQEAAPHPWPLKTPARLLWSQRWPFIGLGSPSPVTTWSLWRRCCWSDQSWRKRISKWKDQFTCLPRLWE